MSTVTMTTKGRFTVPADIRAKLGLRPGDKVLFFINADGELAMRSMASDETSRKGASPGEDGAAVA